MGARQDLGLIELANRTKDGLLIDIAEVLVESEDIIKDAVFIEANGTNTHVYGRRASEISGSWTMVNDFVDRESTVTIPQIENLATREAFSQIAESVLRKVKNQQAFRLTEDRTAASGFAKAIQSGIFYGTGVKDPLGFANRYNKLSMANVFDATGTSNLTSLWIVQWGERKVTFLYPQNSKSGLQVTDDGKVTITNSSGQIKNVWQTHFVWDIGIAIYDDKNIARIANINTTQDFGTNKVDNLMITALNKMPQRGKGAFIYANSDVLTQFDINAKDKTNVQYGTMNVWGEETVSFRGCPVRLSDAIVSESQVA